MQHVRISLHRLFQHLLLAVHAHSRLDRWTRPQCRPAALTRCCCNQGRATDASPTDASITPVTTTTRQYRLHFSQLSLLLVRAVASFVATTTANSICFALAAAAVALVPAAWHAAAALKPASAAAAQLLAPLALVKLEALQTWKAVLRDLSSRDRHVSAAHNCPSAHHCSITAKNTVEPKP